jgi:hypothetical protein
LLFRSFKILTKLCFNPANENYRNRCLQYAPKIKNRITTLALGYDWPGTRNMGKKMRTPSEGF